MQQHQSDIDHPDVQRLMREIVWENTVVKPAEGSHPEWHGPRLTPEGDAK